MRSLKLFRLLTLATLELGIAIAYTNVAFADEKSAAAECLSQNKLYDDTIECYRDMATKYDVDLEDITSPALAGKTCDQKTELLKSHRTEIGNALRKGKISAVGTDKNKASEFERAKLSCDGKEPSAAEENHNEACEKAVEEITEKEKKMQEACDEANISGACLEKVYSCKYAREEAEDLDEDVDTNTEEGKAAATNAQQEKYKTYKTYCKALLGTNLEATQKAYERIDDQVGTIQKSLDKNQENLSKLEEKEQNLVSSLQEQLAEATDELAAVDLQIEKDFKDNRTKAAASLNEAMAALKDLEIKREDVQTAQFEGKAELEEEFRKVNANCFTYASGEVTQDRNCLIEAKVNSNQSGKAKSCRRKKLRISSKNYYNYSGKNNVARNQDDINRYYQQCMATQGSDTRARLKAQLKSLTQRSKSEYARTLAAIRKKQTEIAIFQNQIVGAEAGAGKAYVFKRNQILKKITNLHNQIIKTQSSQRSNAIRANANIMQAHARLAQKQQEANELGMNLSVVEENAKGKNYTSADVMAALSAANSYVNAVSAAASTCECQECTGEQTRAGISSSCKNIIVNLGNKESMIDKINELYPEDDGEPLCDSSALTKLKGAQKGSQ